VSQRVPRAEAHRRILAATSRLLEDRRFRQLTVESVMAQAGLARTVFYRHFESLADVVVGLLDEAVADAADIAIRARDPSVPDVLRAMLERGVELYARHGHLLAAVEEASHHDPEVERVYHEAFERSVQTTASLLAAGVANGHYVLDPLPVARALMHLNAGYLSDVLARDEHGDRDQALATLWTIWARLLGLESASEMER
jgi:AcrR family transcriptional regulator